MQDTTSEFQDSFHTHKSLIDRQKFFQNILQPHFSRSPLLNPDNLNLSAAARKMLETVLINVKITPHPQTRQDFVNLTKQIVESTKLSGVNVALIIRSVADQVKYDGRLHQLVIKRLGFQQETRIFHNAVTSEASEQQSNDRDIGTIQLKNFMILFGMTYELYSQVDEPFFKTKLDQQYDTQSNHDDNNLLLKGFDHPQLSLISPPCSQVIESARQQETQSIIQVLQETQLQSLAKGGALKNDLDKCDETLLANENLNLQSFHMTHSQQRQNGIMGQNKQPSQNLQASGLYAMLSNLQNQKTQPQSFQRVQQSQEKIQERPQIFNEILQNQNFKLFNNPTLLSANNSRFATPIKPRKDSESMLYPNNSDFKASRMQSSKILFGGIENSPKWTPNNQPINVQTRESFMNARTLFHSQQKVGHQVSLFGSLSGKRHGRNIDGLEKNVMRECLTTPNEKRQKLDPYSDVNGPKDSDDSEEEKDDQGDAASSASRKKRGLKILSVKVQELVFKKQSTTYKDVANELIKQLRKNKKKIQEIGGMDDSIDGEDEDDDLSEDSPKKKGDIGDSSSMQQKWEKNVRRRVYDALNVLYAAGVLQKHGKHVSCDANVLQMTKKLKELNHTPSMKSLSARNCMTQHDQKMLQHIEQLKQHLSQQKLKVDQKREVLSEQFKYFISYKHLIQRNKEQRDKGFYDPSKSIALPFILVSTKDSPENEVEISFGDQNKSLNIAMKKQMKCIGDADTLIKLGFYKVPGSWILDQGDEISSMFKLLSDDQKMDILLQE